MRPFCYVVEETDWDNTHVEIFPSYDSMIKWLKKEIQGDRIYKIDLYSVLPDRTKVEINKKDLLGKKSKLVVIQEQIVGEQDEIFWKD